MKELEWIKDVVEEMKKRQVAETEEEIVRRAEAGEIFALKKVIAEAVRSGDQENVDLWMQKFYELFAKKIHESDGIGAFKMVFQSDLRVADYRKKREETMQQQVVKLLEKQLEDGNEEVREYLDRCYCSDISTGTRKTDDAIGLWQELAESGDAHAEWMLSGIYASLTDNEYAAHEWLEKSARHGFAAAQYAMAEGYIKLDEETNEFVGEEAKKAIPWLKMAAEQHDEPMGQRAMLWLGDIYKYGCKEGGIHVDYKKAIYWYKLAAQYGKGFDRKEALIKLAYCYKQSCGATKDTEKAFKMFEALAKIDGRDLPFDLGLIEWANMGLASCLKQLKKHGIITEDKND